MNKKILKTTTILCGIALLGGNAQAVDALLSGSVEQYSDTTNKVTVTVTDPKTGNSITKNAYITPDGEGGALVYVDGKIVKDGQALYIGQKKFTVSTDVDQHSDTTTKVTRELTNEGSGNSITKNAYITPEGEGDALIYVDGKIVKNGQALYIGQNKITVSTDVEQHSDTTTKVTREINNESSGNLITKNAYITPDGEGGALVYADVTVVKDGQGYNSGQRTETFISNQIQKNKARKAIKKAGW